jgi:hypothetical protein
MRIISGSKIRRHIAIVSIFLIMAALIAGISGCYGNQYLPPCSSQNLEIRTWYDLDAVKDNLCGDHTLMNDLDSSTLGYEELAGPMANGGRGWVPIGYSDVELITAFKGTFDGQGYEIHDLFIDGSDLPPFEVGLFGLSYGVIRDIGVVNATVVVGPGTWPAGALVGVNTFGGNVSVYEDYGGVGGLIGQNSATVSDSYSTASVTGNSVVGGLVGRNNGAVSNSYSTGNVTGENYIGGLIGVNSGTVTDSYSTGNVTGEEYVAGLIGGNWGTVGNSFWDTETSGQYTSAGGTSKNTTEMQDIVTFSVAGWNIIAVAMNETNPPPISGISSIT